jgi:hypothetical protein
MVWQADAQKQKITKIKSQKVNSKIEEADILVVRE